MTATRALSEHGLWLEGTSESHDRPVPQRDGMDQRIRRHPEERGCPDQRRQDPAGRQRHQGSEGAEVVDATGMHLTAGIIDEHSHIAISGSVNEATQSSSAEVRIGDVLDADDVQIYRQLAGGVTASHLLHGSANPIGGQTQLIKLRWGRSPEELKFENWPGYIKFALGENVKQNHWGDKQVIRYPQTRMGVEQVYSDYFTRAHRNTTRP